MRIKFGADTFKCIYFINKKEKMNDSLYNCILYFNGAFG